MSIYGSCGLSIFYLSPLLSSSGIPLFVVVVVMSLLMELVVENDSFLFVC